MRDIVLFGVQGAGKGTQAKILAQKHGYRIFETGGQLRILQEEDSELGREVKSILQAGNLVSNDLVMQIIREYVESVEEGVPLIFDGIPRSEVQDESFRALMEEYGRSPVAVEITLADEIAIERMLERGRDDDTPEAIRRRLENFQQSTKPVIEGYNEREELIQIDGAKSVEEVAQVLEEALGGVSG